MPWSERACSAKGCDQTVTGKQARCPEHTKQQDEVRGAPSQRGYDRDYREARADALDGATHCDTCRRPFTAANPATGGHHKAVRRGGTAAEGIGAQCRKCNYGWRATGS